MTGWTNNDEPSEGRYQNFNDMKNTQKAFLKGFMSKRKEGKTCIHIKNIKPTPQHGNIYIQNLTFMLIFSF